MNLFGQNSNSKHKLICYRQLKPPFTSPWMCFEFEFWPSKFIIYTLDEFFSLFIVYIDVGDECWRRNVLMTIIRCWWRFKSFWSPTSTIFLHYRRAPTFKRCHHHRISVTNIHESSSTMSHQHHDAPNITVTTKLRYGDDHIRRCDFF